MTTSPERIMQPIYVLFGTESGNAQGLAKRAGEELAKAGLTPHVIDMMDFAAPDLEKLRRLLIITSTYGNGDPPSNAEELHGFLKRKCPPLPELCFSVFGLGDTTYDKFAQCGKDFDRRLGELGANRVLEREDSDVDYDGPFDAWLAKAVPIFAALGRGAVEASPATAAPLVRADHVEPPGTRRNPVIARVIENVSLTKGSTKDTRHVALSLAGTGLRYELGDSLGVWPTNDPALVSAILAASGADGSARVKIGNDEMPLEEALAKKLDVVHPDVRLVERTKGTLTDDERKSLVVDHQVIDLLEPRDQQIDAVELATLLRPLSPRQYSIASSLLAHPDEVHLTVAIVRYTLGARSRGGVVSLQLAERGPVGTELPVYLHATPSFRLTEGDRPIVMIGPGTGVAPFRAFLEERRESGARGKSWLFFGSRHRATDFLYEKDFDGFLADHTLTRLDLAFSRDQAHKIYVQHRMREHARELYAWIDQGAVVYVCGDAHHMSVDVQTTLVEILASEGGVSVEAARQRLEEMSAQGRYQKDVY